MDLATWNDHLLSSLSATRREYLLKLREEDQETQRAVALSLVDAAIAAGPLEPMDPKRRALSEKDGVVDELMRVALPILFAPAPKKPLLASDLSPEQRDVLTKLSRFEVSGPFSQVGLPAHAFLRRRWLGIDEGGALESIVPSVKAPVWFVMRTLRPMGGVPFDEAHRVLSAELAPEVLAAAYAEATLMRYGLVTPDAEFVVPALLAARGRDASWALWLADDMLAHERAMRMYVSELGVAAVLAAMTREKTLEPRHDVLFPWQGRGIVELLHEVFDALPEARRDALLATRIAEREQAPAPQQAAYLANIREFARGGSLAMQKRIAAL